MKKKKAILNKKDISYVLLWLLLMIVFIASYILIPSVAFRFVLYAISLIWGVDQFVEWISEDD